MRWTTFAVCALLATQVDAIGLGPIEVTSHLNEKFEGRIPITGAPAEATQDLVVALASPEQFRKAGLERPFALALLHFDVVSGGASPYVRVTSLQAIREPALQFLVAAQSPEGTLLQDYTVLLDPAAGMGRVPAATTAPAAPAPAQAPAPAPAPEASTAAEPSAPEAPAPAATAEAATAGNDAGASAGTYGPVTASDTLWSLGDRLRPDDSVSVYQMMVALKRANPEAFSGDRYDGLRKGVSLRIPDTADVRAVTAGEAQAEIQAALGQ